MFRPAFSLLTGLAGVLLLAGCDKPDKKVAAPEPADAAIVDALADPIMSDPDLSGENDAHSAISARGPVTAAFPPIDRSDEAVEAAKNAASALVGGAPSDAPAPRSIDLSKLREAVTAAQMAMASGVARADCVRAVEYTARWAAVLPDPLQVYPRGAVEEAGGTDTSGCGLRVVHFRTPVAIDDLVAFYYARLRAAGYPAEHGAAGDEHVLRGRKGNAAYVVYVRKAEDGLTAADVIVAGA